MIKEKSYAASHKGLRNILSQFSLLAGKTNYSSIKEVNKLKKLGDEMIFLLTHHLHTENDDLLKPLEERVKGASEHDLHDHERLEKIQADIAFQLSKLDGTQDEETGHLFYLAFTNFHSQYLEHILQEELVTEKLLLDNFSAEELQENSMKIMQKVEFPVILMSLKYIIPAQSLNENIKILTAFKTNAPAEALKAVLDIIKPEMSNEDFVMLTSKI
ncbi:MAG TPA: hemerythrin domain-containing protein [Bacteroidia bacterium]|nr:hemerythrin domain-containing protein [Bacteroidia bacterium]HRD39271.1 hemerythrin domain-containing protein [Bacteroidia bacterium]